MSRINTKTFFEKLRFKYKLSILNENTLEEVWFVHLTRLKVYLLTFLLLIILFFINTLLILKTPLKKFTPGYLDSEIRTELINESIRTDSLMKEFKLREEYLNAVKSLMIGDIKIDKVMPIDSVAMKQRELTFIEKSKEEADFCGTFENEEKYNLSVLEIKKTENTFVFCPPTNGIIINKFKGSTKDYGIDIATSPNETVLSVIDGSVIFAGYTIEEGYVIQVQHTDNFISIYKHNSQLLKKVGDQVKSGESIAIVGNTAKSPNVYHLHFELWHEGIPQNPENYITF